LESGDGDFFSAFPESVAASDLEAELEPPPNILFSRPP
jgi:hypothetical protein